MFSDCSCKSFIISHNIKSYGYRDTASTTAGPQLWYGTRFRCECFLNIILFIIYVRGRLRLVPHLERIVTRLLLAAFAASSADHSVAIGLSAVSAGYDVRCCGRGSVADASTVTAVASAARVLGQLHTVVVVGGGVVVIGVVGLVVVVVVVVVVVCSGDGDTTRRYALAHTETEHVVLFGRYV